MIDKPMLATDANLEKIRFPVLASKKYDGIRGLKVNNRALARSFKPIPNDYVRTWMEMHLPNGIDGELTLRDPLAPFRDVTSAIMSKAGKPDFVFRAFDYVHRSTTQAYNDRLQDLLEWWVDHPECHDGGRVDVVTHHLVLRNLDELTALHETWVLDGYEGTMVRDPEGPYKCGRSTVREGYLLRIKPFVDEEATVVGFAELMVNENEQTRDELGRAKRSSAKAGKVPGGVLGALRLTFDDGTDFNCGSGFTDAQKKELWAVRDEDLVGRRAKIKHQAPPGGRKPGQKPRIPVFLGWRDAND